MGRHNHNSFLFMLLRKTRATMPSSATAQRRLAHLHSHITPLAAETGRARRFSSSSGTSDSTRQTSERQGPSELAKSSELRQGSTSDPAAVAAAAAPASAKPAPTPDSKASFYKYFLPFQTTWKDNDQYGHLNNAVYVKYFDGLINEYLVRVCGLKPLSASEPIGLVVASSFKYALSLEFPRPILAGLSVTKLGRSSVTYAVALFSAEISSRTSALPNGTSTGISSNVTAAPFDFTYRLSTDAAACYGSMTHVFVDPKTRRPVEMPEQMKKGLQMLVV